MDIKQVFLNKCDDFKNNIIKEVVSNTVMFIPSYFYIVPSSSSGKYHPEDEISEGGLVLHTLKDVKVLEIMAPMYNFSDYELELARAALLLHDCCKSGYTDSGHTQFLHPKFAANLIIRANNYDVKHYITAKLIAMLVETHMGKWNSNKYNKKEHLHKPVTRLQKFVHECDFIASRKEFNLNLDAWLKDN